MKRKKILIKNGYVISMDVNIGDFHNADILIEGDTITRVAPNIADHDCTVIDASSMIVIPGFVDCHRHMWQTQLRGLTSDWSLFDYTARIRSVLSSFYSPEDAYLGCYAGFLEALSAGVTTIVDHAHIMNSPDHADEVYRAYKDSRIRGILCYGLFSNIGQNKEVKLSGFLSPPWHRDDVVRLKKTYFSSEQSRVHLGVALTEMEFLPLEMSRNEIEFARSIGAKRISAHVGMGALSSGARFVERLSRAGLLKSDLLFIHGWSLTNHELRLLADHGCGLITTPETELQMGMGFPVAWRLLARGGLPGLGVDIVSNQGADMFTQMRLCLQVQRARENEKLSWRGLMPRTIRLKARDALEMATIGGARAIGLDAVTGSISPGKQADITLIRSDAVNMVPVTDPVSNVVMCAHAGNVDTVLVGGDIVKRNGRLVAGNWDVISKKLVESSSRILRQGARKGFDQGQRIMADYVFPLDRGGAVRRRMAAWLTRLPVPFIHRALIKSLYKK